MPGARIKVVRGRELCWSIELALNSFLSAFDWSAGGGEIVLEFPYDHSTEPLSFAHERTDVNIRSIAAIDSVSMLSVYPYHRLRSARAMRRKSGSGASRERPRPLPKDRDSWRAAYEEDSDGEGSIQQ